MEPELPTQVVIDREALAQRPPGASVWSRVEGRKYDEAGEETSDDAGDDAATEDASAQPWYSPLGVFESWESLCKYVIDSQIVCDPENANRTLGDLRAMLAKTLADGCQSAPDAEPV